jgi:hypothetical protein
MKEFKSKTMAFLIMIIFTLGMRTNAYADMIPEPPTPKHIQVTGWIIICDIILLVCIVAIIIIVKIHHKK